jgi:hypothetical protein
MKVAARGKKKGYKLREDEGILRVGKIGNLLLPNKILTELGMTKGGYVRAQVRAGKVILTPVKLAWSPMHEDR